MEKKFKLPDEWFRQADYDLKTAETLFKTGRYIYAVFMCHLSIEKALKGLFAKRLKKDPPKTHDLNYLCLLIALSLPERLQNSLDRLNDLSVLARYPDELKRLLKEYKKDKTKSILHDAKRLLSWLKKRLKQ
jgi:HEPN domain-containing protein